MRKPRPKRLAAHLPRPPWEHTSAAHLITPQSPDDARTPRERWTEAVIAAHAGRTRPEAIAHLGVAARTADSWVAWLRAHDPASAARLPERKPGGAGSGRPRSKARAKVEQLLAAHPDWTDTAIAEKAGVSAMHVGRVRRALKGGAE